MNNVTYVLFAVCIVFAFVIVVAPPAFAVHSISDSPGGGVTNVPAGVEYRFHFNTTGVQDDESESWTAVSTEASCTTNSAAIDSGGVFTWTPVIADVGKTCGFQIIATAVTADSNSHNSFPTFQFMVTSPPNTPPVFVPGNPPTSVVAETIVTIGFAATDADNDVLLATLMPSDLTASVSRATVGGTTVVTFTWTPTTAQIGSHDFTLAIDDQNGGTASLPFTLEVTAPPANRLPTIQPPDNIVLNPRVNQALEFDFDFTDLDGDTVRWLTPTGQSGYHDDGRAGLIGQTLDQNGVFRWTPTSGQVGQPLTVLVTIEEEHQIVRVGSGRILERDNPNVVQYALAFVAQAANTEATNTRPVITPLVTEGANPDYDTTPNVGQTVRIDVNATDVDGDVLEWDYARAALTDIQRDTTEIDPTTGVFTFTPTQAEAGMTIDRIVSVRDTFGGDATVTLRFVVEPNRLPTIQAPTINLNPNVGQRVTFDFDATDDDNDDLTWLAFDSRYRIDMPGSNGERITQDGVFTWTPRLEHVGQINPATPSVGIRFVVIETDLIRYDNPLAPNVITFPNRDTPLDEIADYLLNFIIPNRPPVIEFPDDIPTTVYIDRLVSFELSATDDDGHSPTFTTITPDLGATITPDGAFEWTPDSSLLGTTQEFTFMATDNSPLSSEETTRTHSFVVSEITPDDEVPVIVMYEPVILEGEAIPSLAGAVTDPIEFPEDEEIEYLIHKSSDLPDYISLNSTTGVFSGVFPFDTTATTTTLFFTWTYTDFHGESPPQLGSITVNNNPDLVPTITRGNEGYDIEEYRFTVIDDGPIPPLSTVVTDYPTDSPETPVYAIVDPGNLPTFFLLESNNIPRTFVERLNADTGAFPATFACDSARVGIPTVYTFGWTFTDSTGTSPVQQGTITSQINSVGSCITANNDVPDFAIYGPENYQGTTPHSLSVAVSNPPENPIDRTSVYTITDRGDTPDYILDSLDPQTGDFATQLNCGPLPVEPRTNYRFQWSYQDGSGIYPQTNGQMRVNTNSTCMPLTDTNEVPTSVPYRQEVLEGQPIPRLSTAITNPFEDPADEVSEYIISSGIGTVTVPDYIVDSLNSTTGGFDEVFRCGTVSAGSETTFDLDFAFRDTRATVAALNSVITVIDDPNCITPITAGNDVPEVSTYNRNVNEGRTIPSLSTAVFDPPESSTDGAIRYDIIGGDLFTNVAYGYIVASLDHTTGDFGAVFNCGTLGNGQTNLGFTWTYTDGSSSGGNTQTAPPSAITVNNDNNCLTPENEVPIVVNYDEDVFEEHRITSLSTAVTNPPESSIDMAIEYSIVGLVDPGDFHSPLPPFIAESLNPRTGDFDAVFPCEQVTAGNGITYGFTWTFQDGSDSNTNNIGIEGSPGSSTPAEPDIKTGELRALQNDQCTGLLTSQNEEPEFRTYFSTVRPGGAIPGLDTAVMDPEEDPTDTSIAYRIVNPGNMPEDIASTLVMGTGKFMEQFDDSYLEDVDSRSFVFTWSYQDDNREYEPRTAVLILAENSGGSSNDWKKKPTFGKSWEISSSQLVTDGFTFNDYTLDVTDNWHTEFRRTSSIIGETNSVTLKAFSPDGFSYVALSLGVPEIGMATDAETDIILMLERNYENPDDYDITEIIHEQKESLVDESQTTATVTKVLCNPRDAVPCHSFDINFKVDAPLKSDVLAISAVDSKRRSTTTYINEGVEFTGEAILAPNTHLMVQKKTNQGPAEMLTLTQQDRRYNIWEDDSGYLWAQNDHGSWFSITAPEMERFEDRAVNVMTRMHSNFDSLKHDERQKATMMFDASKLVSVPDATFNYDYSGVSYGVSKMDQLAEELNIEQGKAQKIMELLR